MVSLFDAMGGVVKFFGIGCGVEDVRVGKYDLGLSLLQRDRTLPAIKICCWTGNF